MLQQQIQYTIDNINLTTKTISIAKDTKILDGSVEIASNRERKSFVPGQIEDVKSYLGESSGPEIDYLNAVWTTDVISQFQTNNQVV